MLYVGGENAGELLWKKQRKEVKKGKGKRKDEPKSGWEAGGGGGVFDGSRSVPCPPDQRRYLGWGIVHADEL